MRLVEVEAARDLALDARDLVRLASTRRRRTGVTDVVLGLMSPLLAILRIQRDGYAPVVGDAEYRRAADRLDEYAASLASVAGSRQDPSVTRHLTAARSWGKRLWDDPQSEGPVILAEIQPTINWLVELRTALILGRETGAADRPGQDG